MQPCPAPVEPAGKLLPAGDHSSGSRPSRQHPGKSLPDGWPVDLAHFVARNRIDILQMDLRHARQISNTSERLRDFVLADQPLRLNEYVKFILLRSAPNGDQTNSFNRQSILQTLFENFD